MTEFVIGLKQLGLLKRKILHEDFGERAWRLASR